MSDSEVAERLEVHRAACDEMVLPKIESGVITSETALGDFLMSPNVRGTLKLVAELRKEKFVDTFHAFMDKYVTVLEAKTRFEEAAIAIERRISEKNVATTRVLEGLMAAHECGFAEAKTILLDKTREILRLKVEAAAREAAQVATGTASTRNIPTAVIEYSRVNSHSAKPADSGPVSEAPVDSSGADAEEARRKSKSNNPLTSLLRTAVSKKKKRYVDGTFNLDLSYIPLGGSHSEAQIISMGFPCQGSEQLYRNPYDEVLDFFETRHSARYVLFNLCSERKYEPEAFTEDGSCTHVFLTYRFHDHNPPPMGYFGPFCQDMEDYISAGPENVCAVHCKAGKGRTGTMIVSYLAYKLRLTIPQAMDHFSEHRTMDGKGVTIPSQKRFLYYFGEILEAALAGASVGVSDNAGRSADVDNAPTVRSTNRSSSHSESGANGPQTEASATPAFVHGDGDSNKTGDNEGSRDTTEKSATDAETLGARNKFEGLALRPLDAFFRSLLPPVQPVLLLSMSFLGIPNVEAGGFTPYFVIENNSWHTVIEKNDKVLNTPTWVLNSKQLGLPSNFVRANREKDEDGERRRSSAASPQHPHHAGSGKTRANSLPNDHRAVGNRSSNGSTGSMATSGAGDGEVKAEAAESGPRVVQVLTLQLPEPVEIVNEVRITVYHKNSLRQKKKLFAFWIHTGFLHHETIFSKIEIDGAHKDKKHKIYPASFRLRLNCVKLDPHVSAEDMYKRQSTQAEGFGVNQAPGSGNNDLVSLTTMVEDPGDNPSTLLGGNKKNRGYFSDDDDENYSDEDTDEDLDPNQTHSAAGTPKATHGNGNSNGNVDDDAAKSGTVGSGEGGGGAGRGRGSSNALVEVKASKPQ